MATIRISVKPNAAQKIASRLIVRSTRWFDTSARHIGKIAFIVSGEYWTPAYADITVEQIGVVETLRKLGFTVDYILPLGYREVEGGIEKTSFEMTEYLEAVQHFDPYYSYSDDPAIWRRHDKLNDILNKHVPTIEEAWFVYHVMGSTKHRYIGKLSQEASKLSPDLYWVKHTADTAEVSPEIIKQLSAGYDYLTKPCVFED